MATGLWTKEQIKLAFHLYCQLPYGRIHGRNPENIALAKTIAIAVAATFGLLILLLILVFVQLLKANRRLKNVSKA